MYILGIWDGHDAGAALIDDKNILFAANEERYTRRKLEIGFPKNAINAALSSTGVPIRDISDIAFTTTEFSKTIERLFPGIRENYYTFRRRKGRMPQFEHLRHKIKYTTTGIGIMPGSKSVNSAILKGYLKHMGFKDFKLHVVEHHNAHMATASMTSNMNKHIAITMDGVGDGHSGSISIVDNKDIEKKISIPARDSLGIFFEQATNIIGMRELEDEGKVMAMADYSYPFEIKDNKFIDFFVVEGTQIRARYNPRKQYDMLMRIAWSMPREQFAFMVQQLTEAALAKFVSNCIDRYGIPNVAFSGGIFSNIKANMKIRKLDGLKQWYVFPHMGDGGIALGAALYTRFINEGYYNYTLSAYLGDQYSNEYTEKILRSERSLSYELLDHKSAAKSISELLSKGNYLLLFNGRMEYGPRALGNRSIIAPSDSEYVKERLNIHIKRREWFQPFAPSILEEDMNKIIEYDGKGIDRFMTMAYDVKDAFKTKLKSVVHVDGTARTQIVGDENVMYKEILRAIKDDSGNGIALNTSFNIHGYPIVRSPEDALEMMKKSRTKYMFINGYMVINKRGM